MKVQRSLENDRIYTNKGTVCVCVCLSHFLHENEGFVQV